jgi:hypothetical protein
MRVSLGLNGWPPLASHTAALLVGVALANLSWGHGEASPQLKRGSLTLSFGSSQILWLDHGGGRPGVQVHILRKPASGAACRLTREPWALLGSGKIWAISSPISDTEIVGSVSRALTNKELGLSSAKNSEQIPYCERSPRVIFGQGY